MFEFGCEYCGRELLVDKEASLASYLSKVDYIKDDVEEICDIAMNTFLVYTCINCKRTFEYTLADVELKIRELIKSDVMQFRKKYVIRNDIVPGTVNPDNGIEYCGRCAGADDEGNCYKDVISQCSFRRENNEL